MEETPLSKNCSSFILCTHMRGTVELSGRTVATGPFLSQIVTGGRFMSGTLAERFFVRYETTVSSGGTLPVIALIMWGVAFPAERFFVR
ncbi:hypothetical protein CDL15_Pgr004777 [Punica granatum]|uniref:Uncharacterized protein n=1 Tax=Punica granatum TaxID=22663 RepID=A0A218W698_PUNGR|nr:hypothetical protein CDL15_Pgr004777 [Punica granatum]